jgi:hypothetical protein
MADDGAPKSAIELAMERLRKQDADGSVTIRQMTAEQKAAIAEVRSLYESKIAEQDILQQAELNRHLGADPAEIEILTWPFRVERERLAAERDAKLDKIRQRQT